MNSSKKNNQIIKDLVFSEALSDRYLSYAMSTIVSRSLPDVRAVSYTHLRAHET